MIPEALWQEFRLHRKKLKAPMTEYAEKLILAKLEKWEKETGANPVDILEESIIRGWAGVFLNGHGSTAKRQTEAEKGTTSSCFGAATCCSCGKSLEAGFVYSSKGRKCHNC